MEKNSKIALTAMLNSFPQRAVNPDLLLRTYEQALHGVSDDVICEICKRYVTGEISEQSLTFSPSVAEFTIAARDLIAVRAALRALPGREPEIPREPITARVARVRREYAGRKLLAEQIDLKKYAILVSRGELPIKSEFVAVLGAAYAQ